MQRRIIKRRVLLADEHEGFRRATRMLIERLPGFEVVGEAGDLPEALRLCAELKPDLVVMDLLLPGTAGIESLRQLRAAHPEGRLLALSPYDSRWCAAQALEAGASAYLSKYFGCGDFRRAVRAALRPARPGGGLAAPGARRPSPVQACLN